MQSGRRVVIVSKKALGLVVVALVIALIAWYGMSMRSIRRGVPSENEGGSLTIMNPESVEVAGTVGSKMMPDFYPKNDQISVNDTREFLKTNYRAGIKTRDVPGVVASAKNVVKGNDGRIDSISSSEKSGYLTFVIPKSRLETFEEEIEGLVHRKLLSVTSSSQNLLTEKISIEDQQRNIATAIDNLKKQKEVARTKHTQAVATINRELGTIATELRAIRKEIETTEDQERLTYLRGKESALVSREAGQRQKLVTENSNYAAQDANLDEQIERQNEYLASVERQDTKFTENIETVTGSIQVNWVSVWQLIEAFSPVSPVVLIVIAALIVWNILARFGLVPKFVVR